MSEGCPSTNRTVFVLTSADALCRKQDLSRTSAATRETENGTTTTPVLGLRSPRGVGLLPLCCPASPPGDPFGDAFALAFDLPLGVCGASSTAGAETGPWTWGKLQLAPLVQVPLLKNRQTGLCLNLQSAAALRHLPFKWSLQTSLAPPSLFEDWDCERGAPFPLPLGFPFAPSFPLPCARKLWQSAFLWPYLPQL